MPEPDFDTIGAVFRLDLEEKLAVAMGDSPFRRQFINHFVGECVSQLRLVWNARGAADLDAIDAAVAYTKDGIITGARHQIARAIRKVDR